MTGVPEDPDDEDPDDEEQPEEDDQPQQGAEKTPTKPGDSKEARE